MIDRNAVTDYLNSLGETEQEVYQSLKDLGIRGTQHAASTCPIANVVYRHFGVEAFVCSDQILLTSGLLGDDNFEEVFVSTTPAVASFVEAFDRSRYMDLVGEA
jgi:hypothetical protein